MTEQEAEFEAWARKTMWPAHFASPEIKAMAQAAWLAARRNTVPREKVEALVEATLNVMCEHDARRGDYLLVDPDELDVAQALASQLRDMTFVIKAIKGATP